MHCFFLPQFPRQTSPPVYSLVPQAELTPTSPSTHQGTPFIEYLIRPWTISKQIQKRPITKASKYSSPLKILQKKTGFAWNPRPLWHSKGSTTIIKSSHVITHPCQILGARDLRGQIPKNFISGVIRFTQWFSKQFFLSPFLFKQNERLLISFIQKNKKISTP